MADSELGLEERLEAADTMHANRHFVYTEDGHGPFYNKLNDNVSPELFLDICGVLAEPAQAKDIDVVLGVATGGIALANTCARLLTAPTHPVSGRWALKQLNGSLRFLPNVEKQLSGKGLWLVEDSVNSGGSIVKLIELARKAGGEVLGASSIWAKPDVTAELLDIPTFDAIIRVNAETHPPDDCPLCKVSVPIVNDIGHGARFEDEHPDYPGGFEPLVKVK